MLSRYANVTSDGKYQKASKESLALQRVALVGARTGIVYQSANSGMQALTVAIRFGAVRRQFGGSSPSTETRSFYFKNNKTLPSSFFNPFNIFNVFSYFGLSISYVSIVSLVG